METLPLAEIRETFILRMWRDATDKEQWRCHVQHVRSGEVAAFQGVAAAFTYIQNQLDKSEARKDAARGLR